MQPRTAEELAAVDDPAWPEVVAAVAAATVPVRVLPVADERGRDTLHRLQVTARSVLGALALHSGGIVVDHGWLRLLGGGGEGLGSLADLNGLSEPEAGRAAPGHLVVALDAVGGVFAVDGGDLGVQPGDVCYRGPDTLRWQGLGGGHASFVLAALDGAFGDAFYGSLRWPGWADDVAALALDQGVATWPPPWTVEGADLAHVSRRPVPHAELRGLLADAARQLDGPVADTSTTT